MALSQSVKLLHVVLFLFASPCLTYTIYGTKRYGHSSAIPRVSKPSWNLPVQPYQQFIRTERYPSSYYEMYPYGGQQYAEEYYYPQDTVSYPVYYPPPRTSKYEVYQAVLPYYYGETPVMRPAYGYYGYDKGGDPLENLEEEMIQETEREEREESQPIGQEILYENDSQTDDNFDDVNAAFLQNLIMTQMYKDSLRKPNIYYDQNPNPDYYVEEPEEKWDSLPVDSVKLYQEDEDVKELKQLADPQRYNKPKFNNDISSEERQRWLRTEGNPKTSSKGRKFEDTKIDDSNNHNWQNKRESRSKKYPTASEDVTKSENNDFYYFESKTVAESTPAPSASKTTETSSNRLSRGQKEEVLMRPATPVRQIFPLQNVDPNASNKPERKRTPSVYETIKHMLEMERKLENDYNPNELKPKMRKRIISSEDSLTQQLSVLKKTS